MGELRSEKMLAKYLTRLTTIAGDTDCKLCILPVIESFTYWNIVPNEYPYDLIASTHHMIQPKRHCTAEELTSEELAELQYIKQHRINGQYDFMSENFSHKSSIPAHHHLHLIVIRDQIGHSD